MLHFMDKKPGRITVTPGPRSRCRQQLLLSMLPFIVAACSGTGGVTVADEQQAGNEIARQVEDQVGLYNDDYLKNYVGAVGRRLLAELGPTPYSFRFALLDQADPNAFATPGGYVYVSRGLLAMLNSEDELAGILAHEISHVTRRHHAQQAQRSVLPGLLTVPGKVVGAVVSEDVGNLMNAPLEAAGQVYLSAYGREQESEADRDGMALAARAGYDPAALADALVTLEQTVTLLTGNSRRFSFFDTHPLTPSRVADIRRSAASLDPQASVAFAPDRAALYQRLDGLIWGPGNPAQGLFRDNLFLQPDMDFAVVFPPGWDMLNTPRFVGAKAPDDRAILILGPAGPLAPPGAYADAFIKELRETAAIEPDENAAFTAGEWPGQYVRIRDTSGYEPASIYYVWVKAERTMFQIIGAGLDSRTDLLRDAALSLRPLTRDERASIRSYRIRRVLAGENDSLESLGIREDNQWGTAFTAAINGLDGNTELAPDQPVKILRAERY